VARNRSVPLQQPAAAAAAAAAAETGRGDVSGDVNVTSAQPPSDAPNDDIPSQTVNVRTSVARPGVYCAITHTRTLSTKFIYRLSSANLCLI